MDAITEELVKSSTATLKWLVAKMGVSQWELRREKVVSYFNEVSERTYNPQPNNASEKKFDPIAFYGDWLAWYMYLIESQELRPTSGDIVQLARILPTFAALGKRLDLIKKIEGIDDKIAVLVHEKNNDPDAIFFELLVAGCYIRNGWTVKFIKENNSMKTPDFVVERKPLRYLVECKRLAKVNSYAESERLEWQKLVRHLFGAMDHFRTPVVAEINFKVELNIIPETLLGQAYFHYRKHNAWGSQLKLQELDLIVQKMDFDKVTDHLKRDCIKPGTPNYINLLTGSFDMHGNYTAANGWTEVQRLGFNDPYEAINEFICGLHTAYVAKWESLSVTAIDFKAKDIKKVLANAVKQIPDGEAGIVHIGYETVSGPNVEVLRQQKIKETIDNFLFGSKNIQNIFCHALQPLVSLNGIECAETTIYNGNNPMIVLQENLLIDIDGIQTSDSTHWHQDLNL